MTVAAPDVEAIVNYVSPDTPRDRALIRNADSGKNNFELHPTVVSIHDVRGQDWEHEFALDVHGFAMQRAPTTPENVTALRNQDSDYIKAHYYPECAALLHKLTGGRVIVFNHVVRLQTPDGAQSSVEGTKRQPAGFVHVDHTPNCIPPLVQNHLSEEDEEMIKSGRFQVINVWRPLMEPVQSWPLALADFRSLRMEDVVDVAVHVPRPEGTEPLNVPLGQFRHRDSHQWNYLSNQKLDEVLCLKTYDSAKGAAFCMHTAFDNPLAKDAPPRESVEIRAIVYYPEE